MATAPIQMETVPIAEKKDGIVSSVQEIREEVQPAILVKHQPAILVPSAVTKQFQCEWPTVDANVNRVQEPLPFPRKLKDLIAWTDAFVDRIAVLTDAEEQKNIYDKAGLQAKINNLKIEVEKAKNDRTKAINERVKAQEEAKLAKQDLKKALATIERQIHTIELLEKKEKETNDKNTKLAKKNSELEAKLKFVLAKNDELSDRLAKTDANYKSEAALHKFDHEALEKEHTLFENEKQKRLAVEKKLTTAETKLKDAEAKIIKLDSEVKELQTKLKAAECLNDELKCDVATLNNQLEEAQLRLKEANITIGKLKTAVEVGREHIAKVEQELKKAQEEVKKQTVTIATLTAEKKLIEEKLAKSEARAKDTQKQLDCTLKDLENEIQEKREAEKREQETDEKLDRKNQELRKAEDDLAAAKKALAAEKTGQHNALEAAKRKANPVTISKVKYGPVDYVSLLDKIYKHAQDGTSFTADNTFFIADPQVGVFKSWSIDYEVDGKSRNVQGQEHQKVKFDYAGAPKSAPIKITKVQYGPIDYVSLLNKIHKHAQDGTSFKADNTFFVADPQVGVFKSWTFEYEVDGKRVRLEGKEHDEVKFDLNKK